MKTKLKLAGKAAFVNGVGRAPRLGAWFEKLSCWIEFSRWCVEKGAVAGKYGTDSGLSQSPRYGLYESVIKREELDANAFDYLEFGVYRGDSIAWWRTRIVHPNAQFIGFDTFTGLPEQWYEGAPSGAFSTAGEPPVMDDARVCFHVGLFQETLPKFVQGFARNKKLVIHLDADLYSSTLFVLVSVASLLRPGDLLFFDEFATPTHEFRAFNDFVKAYGLQYEVIGAVNNFNQLCLKVVAMRGMEITRKYIDEEV
jgi:O-methyltransferase